MENESNTKKDIKNIKRTNKITEQILTNQRGITLIALVITIIILLILSGITIATLTGENGLFARAKEAKEKASYGQAEEKVKLSIMTAMADDTEMTVEELKKEIEVYKGSIVGTQFPVEVQVDEYTFIVEGNGAISKKDDGGTTNPIPEVLEIGSTVTYTPSGTYNWQAKYCSTTQTEDVLLNSAETDYKISEWKVLDIENGKVILVPTTPTIGKVYLGQAQGYNNGVKLLNDACSSLYGNSEKGILARSMNIEDIEKYMTEEALKEAHEHKNGAKYGEQISTPSTNSKNYPVMYTKEKLSVIDGIKNEKGLGMSEQTEFIEKTENGATDGKIEAKTSIQPYQTYWYKDNIFMQTGFKTANNGTKYYDLIIPKGSNTEYWLASRCVYTEERACSFHVRHVSRGCVYAFNTYFANDKPNGESLCLFPIVSMNAKLITGDKTKGFTVNL